jgi:2-aminoadipate transaminase
MTPPDSFAFEHLMAARAPKPDARFAGFPRYNFVGGHNSPEQIPVDALAKAAEAVLKREGQKLALYNLGHGGLGFLGLRQFLSGKLNRHRGMRTSAETILVTSGSGQGIDLVNRLFVEPGDTVLIEEFSYLGAINKARAYGARVIGIPLDHYGMRMNALEEMLTRLKHGGVTPKYIYTIPTIQNPTSTVMPLERRRQLIELSRRFGVPIFEDECYADLTWKMDAPPSLQSLAPGQVIHIGSFSKTLAPALRLGYAVADWSVLGRMLAMKADGGTGALDQMVAAEYFGTSFEEHIGALTTALHGKLAVMVEALEREFGTSVEIWQPAGGLFVWIKLPDDVDTRSFAAKAMDAGVAFNPGPEWACDPDKGRNFLRLCYALPSEDDIRDGIAELANVCFEEIGLPVRSGNRACA